MAAKEYEQALDVLNVDELVSSTNGINSNSNEKHLFGSKFDNIAGFSLNGRNVIILKEKKK